MRSSGVGVVVVVGATLALGGCGGSTPSAQTSRRTQTRTETKTVSASSAAGSLPALVARTRSAVVRIQAYGCGSGTSGPVF